MLSNVVVSLLWGLTFLWWCLSFRKSEEAPAGSQWGETVHLYALSESFQWPWSSAAAWTHSHRYSHDIHTHYLTWRQQILFLFFSILKSHANIICTRGETVIPVFQERSPVSVRSAARPSPRPAHSSLTSASTLERSPTCVIAVAKGQYGDESKL